MTSDIKLRPCPFCGGEMEDRGYGAVHLDPQKCPIGDLAVAVDRWNTRPPPKEASMIAAEMPKWIWLIPDAGNDGETVWCDDPAPGVGMDPDDAVEYVRADIITDLAEENRRLREALQPFAEVAEHDIGDDEADCDAFRPMFRVNRAPYLTVGDLRRARATLSSGEASHD